MRPLTVLTGIVLGSAAAATFALVATLVVFAFLIDEYPQYRSELPLLTICTVAVAILTGLAACSFIGQVRERPWRWWALSGMWALLATIVVTYVRVRLQR
jgi:uncharacterized membrane protein YhaH (DUF805 family)